MKAQVVFALFVIGIPLGAKAQPSALYLEETVSIGPPDGLLKQVGVRKTWITRDQLRIESGRTVEIYDAGRSRYISLDRTDRTFLVVAGEDVAAAGQVAPAAMFGITVDDQTGEPRVPAHAFQDTGRHEAVGPRTAEVWETTEPDYDLAVDRIWISSAAPIRWSALEEIVRRVYTAPSSPLSSWFDQVKALPGYPVQVERRGPDRTIRYTVTHMTWIDADPRLFERPNGYRERVDPTGLPNAR